MRKVSFIEGEYYHIYNRGVDKRQIFMDKGDLLRFIKSILIFNRLGVSSGIRDELKISRGSTSGREYEVDYKKLLELSGGLVEIICFCLNPNHYHLLVKQVSDNGISKFMQKLGTGYTYFMNDKLNRSGSLFQGKFKAVHIKSNEQLLYTSAYVNLNNDIHNIAKDDESLVFSSWSEYCGENKVLNMCEGKDIILGQFDNINDYKKFTESVVESARNQKEEKRKDNLE